MKRRSAFFSLLILLGLVLASAYPAAANRPGDKPAVNSPTTPGKTHSPQTSLGASGLSFRYASTFGVTDQPYPADTNHFNSPDGVFVDGSSNLYVVEQNGQRVLGYSTGGNFFQIGYAGLGRSLDNFLNNPRDAAKDSNGNLWVVMENAIRVFSPSGSQVMTFPQANPGQSGNSNAQFNVPNGIAFDHNGRLFVSDENNQRVQVYTVSGIPPTLTYVNTIGVTGVSGGDNTHFFNPGRIAFDSSNALYVVDTINFRVQKCTSTNNWANWTCSTFYSGLTFSTGIAIDHNDQVFIADGDNNQVLKCSPDGTCHNFAGEYQVSGSDNGHFGWVPALATDSSGDVYVCDQSNDRIQVFDKNGTFVKTIGATQAPYVADTQRYYEPWSIAAAGNGGVYIGENHGDRLIKVNPNGTQAWTVGQAGVITIDPAVNGYFGSFGASATAAETADGKVYIPDAGNNRIQIYAANAGGYIGSMAQYIGQNGVSDQFNGPFGVAINPVNQDILVADYFNDRVQVFDSSWAYKTTIGETGVASPDNGHFNGPVSVAVSSSGAVFVADRFNMRVQQCTTSDGFVYTCTVFAGVTGENGSDFAHLRPSGIALDKNGRLYVADDSNNRVQVFDATGAYMATIGGSSGPSNNQLRQPEGVAVDQNGNVYITDTYNQRIQKFLPGVYLTYLPVIRR